MKYTLDEVGDAFFMDQNIIRGTLPQDASKQQQQQQQQYKQKSTNAIVHNTSETNMIFPENKHTG